jgi:cytochrome c6
MKTLLAATSVVFVMFFFFQTASANDMTGKELFEKHCAVCHPDGGNIVNPDYTLHKEDREEHGVKTAEDIMGKMRNPGPGMTQFDKKTIPDDQAKKIAEYILKTF